MDVCIIKTNGLFGIWYTGIFVFAARKWKMGKKNGYGVRTWSEGQVYSGEWSNGKMNGNTPKPLYV